MAEKKKSARQDDIERYGFPLTLKVARAEIAKWEGLSEAQDKTLQVVAKVTRRLRRELRQEKRERRRAERDGWDRAMNTLVRHGYNSLLNQCNCRWTPDSANGDYTGQWVEHLRSLYAPAGEKGGKTLASVG